MTNWNNEYPIGQIITTYGNIDPRTPITETINMYISSLISYNGFYNIKRHKIPTSVDINILDQIFILSQKIPTRARASTRMIVTIFNVAASTQYSSRGRSVQKKKKKKLERTAGMIL